eukprot:TRINITY_DN32114_c0_g1_i2.p1 TRINITY_DN32114_c0_g1~~TRINITY_DN32114_c0_g1_i2.p1  ORF type:complete len:907 (+),score=232.70 TRINITY_DN32114_c0_g1_i2:307-2721(+)
MQATLQAEVDHRESEEGRSAKLEVQLKSEVSRGAKLEVELKEIKVDVADLLALKVKPRLTVLEREVSENRRRMLMLPTCSSLGEHVGSCRRAASVGRGRHTSPSELHRERSLSPRASEMLDKARRRLEDAGEALLERARNEMARQEEVAKSRAASERRLSSTLDEAGRMLAEEARAGVRLSEQMSEQVAVQTATKVAHEAVRNTSAAFFEQAASTFQEELKQLRGTSLEDPATLRNELLEMKSDATEAEVQLRREFTALRSAVAHADVSLKGDLSKTQACTSEAVAGLQVQVAESRTWLLEVEKALRVEVGRTFARVGEAEKTLRADVERAFVRAGEAESEAQIAVRLGSRLSSGILGVEQLVERKTEATSAMRVELEAAINKVSTSAEAALTRTARSFSTELIAEEQHSIRCEESAITKLRRVEDACAMQSKAEAQASAQAMDRVHQALAATEERRLVEERDIWASVQDLSRSARERAPQERQALVEATNRGIAEARSEMQRELGTLIQTEVQRMREEQRRELSALRLEMTSSFESQAAMADNRAERRVEDLLRDRLSSFSSRERNEARARASATEQLCENASRAIARKAEEQATALASQAEGVLQTFGRRAEASEIKAEAEARASARTASVAQELVKTSVMKVEELAEASVSKVEELVKASESKAQELVRSSCEEEARLLSRVREEAALAVEQATLAEEQSGAAKASLGDSRQAVNEVRSELHEFIDEQRVFCGFLDTEQRSYQDLIRQEVSALSRLVDSSLRSDQLPRVSRSRASTPEGLRQPQATFIGRGAGLDEEIPRH